MIIADKDHIAFKNDQFSGPLAIGERNYYLCKSEIGYSIAIFGMVHNSTNTDNPDLIRVLMVDAEGLIWTGRCSLRTERYFALRKSPRTQLITLGSATDQDSEESMGLLIRAAKKKHGWSVKEFYERAQQHDNFLFNELLSIKDLKAILAKATDNNVDYFFKVRGG